MSAHLQAPRYSPFDCIRQDIRYRRATVTIPVLRGVSEKFRFPCRRDTDTDRGAIDSSVSIGAFPRPPRSMPITGLVPQWLLSIVAVATVFTVMFDIGLAIEPGEFQWVGERPGLMLKALFS